MVYIFKRLNDLAGNPTSNESGNVIAGQAAGATQGTHESTYRNPSAVYNANVGQDMGQLETGVNKNIAQTQVDANKSSDAYKSQLQGVDSNYKYGGMQDLENINDSGTFSRLSSLVNPAGAQSQLAGVKSNTANYRPDTSGVAQSSNMGGLTAQLQNQYGTSAGGSRLDALLYRGSGQAGKAIQQGLGQINQFNQGQQQQLGQESNLLSQLKQNAVNKSNQLKSEGAGYQNELQTSAANQAKQQQNQYDTQRQQGIDSLTNQRNSINIRQQMQDAINKGFGGRSVINEWQRIPNTNIDTASRLLQESGIPGDIANQMASQMQYSSSEVPNSQGDGPRQLNSSIDLTDYFKNQLADKFSSNVNLNSIDPSQYVSGAQTYDQNSFLDPRYNQISQLLGTNQITPNSQNYTPYSTNNQGFNDAISAYLNPQMSQAQQAVEGLFNKPTTQEPNNLNPYLSSLVGVVQNPYLANAVLAGPTGGLNLTPGGQRIQQMLQQNLGGAVGTVGSKIENLLGSVGSGLGIGGW